MIEYLNMNAYMYQQNQWIHTDCLWQAFFQEEQWKAPFVITLVGAGGKTSLIRRLAFEGRNRGLRVLVVTTTHMYRPSRFGVLSGSAEDVKRQLLDQGLAVAGNAAGEQKISFVGEELYREICPMADLVLVEGDGSRRLPVKAPGSNEPVIPENSDLVLAVCGLSALGQPGAEVCFRLEYVLRLLETYGRAGHAGEPGWILASNDLACLMKFGYLKPLRTALPQIPVIPVLNQADTEEMEEQAKHIFRMMGGKRPLAEERKAGLACCLITGGLPEDESAGIF